MYPAYFRPTVPATPASQPKTPKPSATNGARASGRGLLAAQAGCATSFMVESLDSYSERRHTGGDVVVARLMIGSDVTVEAHSLDNDDGTFRWARLGWVGGVRNTYLFADQDGMNSFSISLARLADKLRRGEAVLVERKSITESAFGKLMNLFRQKLGHA